MAETYQKHVGAPQEWWIESGRHRRDGPALIFGNGRIEYWEEGKLHRLDGPAITDTHGKAFWFINGKNVTTPITQWAEEMQMDLNNLSLHEKFLIICKWSDYHESSN